METFRSYFVDIAYSPLKIVNIENFFAKPFNCPISRGDVQLLTCLNVWMATCVIISQNNNENVEISLTVMNF